PGWGDLSNMFAWTRTYVFYFSDGDETALPVSNIPAIERHSDIQNELLFTSNKFGRFQVTAGAYYYGATGRYDPLTLNGLLYGGPKVTLNIYGRQRIDAYAAF